MRQSVILYYMLNQLVDGQSVILYYNRHSILVSYIDQLSTSSSMITPPQQPSGRVLASSVSWFQPPSQGPHFTKDFINMVPVVPLFSPQHSKGEILALSEELRQDKNVNLIQKSFKVGVIGRCGGDEKTNEHAEPTKVER